MVHLLLYTFNLTNNTNNTIIGVSFESQLIALIENKIHLIMISCLILFLCVLLSALVSNYSLGELPTKPTWEPRYRLVQIKGGLRLLTEA